MLMCVRSLCCLESSHSADKHQQFIADFTHSLITALPNTLGMSICSTARSLFSKIKLTGLST